MTPWTIAHQAPLPAGFSRQEYWSGLPVASPGDLPDPGIKPVSPALQADSLLSEPPGKPILREAKLRLRNACPGSLIVTGGAWRPPLTRQCTSSPKRTTITAQARPTGVAVSSFYMELNTSTQLFIHYFAAS